KGALRGLRRRPLQAGAAVVMIAVGVGLSATAFTILYGTVLRGLPFEDAERLVHFERSRPSEGQLSLAVTPHDYVDWRAGQTSFEDLGAYVEAVALFANEGAPPTRFSGLRISANSFPLLRVSAARGRTLLAEDESPSAPPVVLLGHAIWSTRFGGDPELVGRMIPLNGVATTVVGIMPEGFGFPIDEQVWLPLQLDLSIPRGSGRLDVFGRLAPGVTEEAARIEFQRLSDRIARAHPDSNAGVSAVLRSFTEEYVGPEFVGTVYRMLAGALLVLLIGCINVMHLLLAHTSRRREELAVRTALGASRGRLMRQLMTETVVLAVMGAGGAWVVAQLGVGWFNRAAGQAGVFDLPHGPSSLFWWDVRVDASTLVWLTLLTLLVALLAGGVPAYRGAAEGRLEGLGRGGRLGGGRGAGRFASQLVLAEIALSASLLTVGGFVVQSTLDVAAADNAIDPVGVYATRVDLPAAVSGSGDETYAQVSSQAAFAERMLDRLRSIPGVESVAIGTYLPLSRPRVVDAETRSTSSGADLALPQAGVVAVSPGYFRVIGAGLLAGREFGPQDRSGAPSVALVNQSFVEMHLPTGWQGAEIRLSDEGRSDEWTTVVGVVPDLWEDPRNPARNAGVYLPLAQADQGDVPVRLGRWELRYQAALIRRGGPMDDLGALVQDAVFQEDSRLPVRPVQPLSSLVDAQLARYGLWGRFYLVFAAVGLLLATVGIYGVLAFSVEGRSREIGIRRALGATAESVASDVVLGVFRRVALGGGLGLLAGYWLATGLGQVFYGLDTGDVRVWAGVAGLMVLVGLLSSWIPARRAARIHPADAVRAGG
ncbi:MAG: FtsX-like permease family protein, partial [Gemmatimonadetes bacterium]|nr:FtsX-like permease family protein [Gemmatimonadota bacterium]